MERLFRLTKREYYADFLITLPITFVFLIISAIHNIGVMWAGRLLLGIAIWTFYEYAVHRWVLHAWITWFHAWHHEDQRDYIALHPILTVAMYCVSLALFGQNHSDVFLGFSVGYVIYAALHTAFHYATIKSGHPLFKLKRRHAIHHSIDDNNYGVVTGFWDRVFGTEWK